MANQEKMWRIGKVKPLLPMAAGGVLLAIGLAQACTTSSSSGNLMGPADDVADTAADGDGNSNGDIIAANLMAPADAAQDTTKTAD